MELRISHRHSEMSDAVRKYIEKKMTKFDRHLPNVQEVAIEMSTQTTRTQGEVHIAQATMRVGREILRSEVHANDPFEAIDAMLAKLQRQVERYRGKRQDRWRGRGNTAAPDPTAILMTEDVEVEDAEEETPMVRRKRFPVYPMSEQEAVEQMELLGHDFYLYQNPSSGQVNLVYRRKGGGYGLLEPEMA